MSWAQTAREKQLAPIGQYKPEAFCIVVHDSFKQCALRMAAQVIRNGMTVPEFLLFCAGYVIRNHREFKRFRSIFRKRAKDIKAAAAAPVDESEISPYTLAETVRDRRREEAFDRFARWAERELYQDITGEKP
jgi:hypothetical protein